MIAISFRHRGRDLFHRTEARVDASLSLMLGVQIVTMFIVIPLGWRTGLGRGLLDACHMSFAAISVCVLARRRITQAFLLGALALLLCVPRLGVFSDMGSTALSVTGSSVAFVFIALVTTLVAGHVFDGSRGVTKHRLRGAVLIYLNVAALFSIAYGALDMLVPGAIAHAGGEALARTIPPHTAELTYFSLTTITTTGFGDLVPVDPIARALANLESVFGHLFPATLLARLVALHVAHAGATSPPSQDEQCRGGLPSMFDFEPQPLKVRSAADQD